MILYTVQVSVHNSIVEGWQQWMRSVHIPEVLETGCFTGAEMRRILEPAADEGYTAFCFEYRVASPADFERYQREHAPALQKDHNERYAGKFTARRSVAELVQSFG